MPEKSICIIDPFENIFKVYRIILEEKGFSVSTTALLDQALPWCINPGFSIIISECFFPLEKMVRFIRSVKKAVPETYLIISTSVIIDDSTYKEMFDAGLDDFLVKPYGQEKLLAHIEKGMMRQELFKEKIKNEKGIGVFSTGLEDHPEVYGPAFFKKLIRQEIKKARRHQEEMSLILVKLPSKEKLGNRFGSFYGELIDLLRKSLREEDLIGRENGSLGIILDKTDGAGSQNLGKRLSKLIQTHPAFQSDLFLQGTLSELAFQYYTFPQQTNIPEFLTPLLKEMDIEFPSR